MKMKFKWERITVDHNNFFDTYRAKVIGGWLVCDNESMVFVSDPNHEWEIDKE